MNARRAGLLAGAALALRCTSALAAAILPCFPAAPAAPAGAPNVLVIMTDDVGFAAGSTFGGGIPTPTQDALAASGLRYTNFHVTALCSPSRAALLTGRNHHAVGFGSVADLAHGEPGYDSIIPKSAGTIGQILSAAGYDTAFLGKNHNVPTWQSGPLGPRDQWGSGLGFGYFYGFNGGLTNQFFPELVENDHPVEAPKQPGYILDRDLADHAISWLRMQRTQGGGRPFLLYYAPGTAHAPIQAPADWIARFKGRFDAGWDAYRQQIFARQKRLGIIPADAKLAETPGIRPWNTLTADQKRLYARYMEVYAAALAYCDEQIGRVVGELKRTGQFDNTLVIYVQGDNGASAEGGDDGAFDYAAKVSGTGDAAKDFAWALAHIDEIGGSHSFPVAPAGWAVAMNTPFPYFKAVASRLGGITDGMVVSWPARIAARGVRTQFTHLTDIAPSILEAAGITAPATLNGVAQQPFDGTSFAYSFAAPEAPERHTTQYFEMMGNQALYKDGWLAATRVIDGPGSGGFKADLKSPWQLYDLRHDVSQSTDVADHNPQKLAELETVYRAEAARNHVFPLVTNSLAALLPASRPEVTAAAGRFTFYPSGFRYSEGTFPSINNRAWTVDADLDVGAGGGEGVLVTQGGRFSGWGLVLLHGVPTFLYRASDRDDALVRVAAPRALDAGHHHVAVAFASDAPGIGKGGTYALSIDGRVVAKAAVERTVAVKFSPEDGVIGRDTGTALTDEYRPPFAFDGTLRALTVDLGPAATLPAAK